MKSKWETVGSVDVDAGILWIGDPCYILHRDGQDRTPKDIGSNWHEFCDKISDASPATEFKHNHGGPGLGVVVGGFGGDGTFPVQIRKRDGYVTEMRVKFF